MAVAASKLESQHYSNYSALQKYIDKLHSSEGHNEIWNGLCTTHTWKKKDNIFKMHYATVSM